MMGFLDRLFGSSQDDRQDYRSGNGAYRNDGYGNQRGARSEDEIALERYRYLLRTAPPETIEQVHTEAFSKLTPEQRDMLFEELKQTAPAGEAPRGNDPASLASAATRSELRQPGTLERTMSAPAFGGGGNGRMGGGFGGGGFGSMFASSLLGSVAGYVIGSALVSAFMPDPGYFDGNDAGGDGGSDAGADASADGGGYDGGGDSGFGGGGFDDFGGDFGDF
jgi:hypothetical protein